MNKKKIKKNFILILQKGFSLIELLVVVAIIGILAGIGIIGYDSYVEYTRRAANEANAKLLANLLSAELTAQRGRLKSNCQQNMSRGADATDWTWSSCTETLMRSNSMINPYTNKIYGSSPVDLYGIGTWTYTWIWGNASNNTYNSDEGNWDYAICGACSDDAGGISAVYKPVEASWNPSTEKHDKINAYIVTCSVSKGDEQDLYTWTPIARRFFEIQQ
jgi:type IV pilus assembly protein PilA